MGKSHQADLKRLFQLRPLDMVAVCGRPCEFRSSVRRRRSSVRRRPSHTPLACQTSVDWRPAVKRHRGLGMLSKPPSSPLGLAHVENGHHNCPNCNGVNRIAASLDSSRVRRLTPVAMLPAVRRSSLLPLPQVFRLRGFIFSTSSPAAASEGGTPSLGPSFISEYLVKSCGCSPAEALKASKSLSRIQSTEQLETVVTFLRSQGLGDAHLKKLISWKSEFLCWNVEKKLAPKFNMLQNLGISKSDLIDVVLAHPCIIALGVQNYHPKLAMWENLFGSRAYLLKHLKSQGSRWFLGHSTENRLVPNLTLLRDECGIPQERVSLIVRKHPTFIVQNPATLRASVDRAEELGMPRKSALFLWAVYTLFLISRENVDAKIELMKSLGWSDSEFSAAFRKAPKFLCISQKELMRKMKFLVAEAGCTPSCIAQTPTLLLYSLDKRTVPRFRAMETLKSKGLYTAQFKLISLLTSSHAKFMEKFILPHTEKVPQLFDIMGVAAS